MVTILSIGINWIARNNIQLILEERVAKWYIVLNLPKLIEGSSNN